MNSKKLLLIVFALFFIHLLPAQCYPDLSVVDSEEMFLPSPGTALPDGSQGIPYNGVISIHTPDSMFFDAVGLFGVPFPVPAQQYAVAEVVIGTVIHYPAGLNSTYYSPPCTYMPDSLACIDVSGIPTAAGDDSLSLEVYPTVIIDAATSLATMGLFPPGEFLVPIPLVMKFGVHIEAMTGQEAGPELSGFRMGQNIPNPAEAFTEIPFVSPQPGTVNLEIYDLNGRLIETRLFAGEKGENSIPVQLEEYAPGIYPYTLRFEEVVRFGKMVKM